MDFKKKYIKYKSKYLHLKKIEQFGGSKEEVEEAWKLIIEYSSLLKKKYGSKLDGK